MKDSIAPLRLRPTFDDDSVIANAGLAAAALFLDRLGLEELAERRLTLSNPDAAPNPGDKLSTLICSALAGGDCIDDADVLRSGDTARALGFRVKAPSAVGTFMRSFKWANVRQLDAIGRTMLASAWALGAGPGAGPLTIDVDSTICQTHGSRRQGAGETACTGLKGYHPLIASRSGSGEILHARLRRGVAHTGKGTADFIAETISRARSAGARGPITVRADSGFYSYDFARACNRRGAQFSIAARDMRAAHVAGGPGGSGRRIGRRYPTTRPRRPPRSPTWCARPRASASECA